MDEEDRPLNYITKKYDVLRKVPAYENLIREHFNRCLDLYLCPRARRKKLNIGYHFHYQIENPEALQNVSTV